MTKKYQSLHAALNLPPSSDRVNYYHEYYLKVLRERRGVGKKERKGVQHYIRKTSTPEKFISKCNKIFEYLKGNPRTNVEIMKEFGWQYNCVRRVMARCEKLKLVKHETHSLGHLGGHYFVYSLVCERGLGDSKI